jgi:hypothetical protein
MVRALVEGLVPSGRAQLLVLYSKKHTGERPQFAGSEWKNLHREECSKRARKAI